jgi:hypothetical protein
MWNVLYYSLGQIVAGNGEHSDSKKKPLHFILGFDNNTVILKKS